MISWHAASLLLAPRHRLAGLSCCYQPSQQAKFCYRQFHSCSSFYYIYEWWRSCKTASKVYFSNKFWKHHTNNTNTHPDSRNISQSHHSWVSNVLNLIVKNICIQHIIKCIQIQGHYRFNNLEIESSFIIFHFTTFISTIKGGWMNWVIDVKLKL